MREVYTDGAVGVDGALVKTEESLKEMEAVVEVLLAPGTACSVDEAAQPEA